MGGGETVILVDISVPTFMKEYDFRLRDDVPIREVIIQVCHILFEREQCIPEEEQHEYTLCSITEQKILNKENTLCSYNIRSGNRLMLI
ncbi:MAG TPA: EsaB/YukD family protein [Lachnospiraceae bacterium]|jgi:uncharacterized ubiquitin-like protein YukD|nr:EsaB/YukD family protein [Lachnospiraceae bacterium]